MSKVLGDMIKTDLNWFWSSGCFDEVRYKELMNELDELQQKQCNKCPNPRTDETCGKCNEEKEETNCCKCGELSFSHTTIDEKNYCESCLEYVVKTGAAFIEINQSKHWERLIDDIYRCDYSFDEGDLMYFYKDKVKVSND